MADSSVVNQSVAKSDEIMPCPVTPSDRSKLVPEVWRNASVSRKLTADERRARVLCIVWVLSRTSTKFCESFLPFLKNLDSKNVDAKSTDAKSADPATMQEVAKALEGGKFGTKAIFGPGFNSYGNAPVVPTHVSKGENLADSEIDGYIAQFVKNLIRRSGITEIENFVNKFQLSPIICSPTTHFYEGNGLFYEMMLQQQVLWKSTQNVARKEALKASGRFEEFLGEATESLTKIQDCVAKYKRCPSA